MKRQWGKGHLVDTDENDIHSNWTSLLQFSFQRETLRWSTLKKCWHFVHLWKHFWIQTLLILCIHCAEQIFKFPAWDERRKHFIRTSCNNLLYMHSKSHDMLMSSRHQNQEHYGMSEYSQSSRSTLLQHPHHSQLFSASTDTRVSYGPSWCLGGGGNSAHVYVRC